MHVQRISRGLTQPNAMSHHSTRTCIMYGGSQGGRVCGREHLSHSRCRVLHLVGLKWRGLKSVDSSAVFGGSSSSSHLSRHLVRAEPDIFASCTDLAPFRASPSRRDLPPVGLRKVVRNPGPWTHLTLGTLHIGFEPESGVIPSLPGLLFRVVSFRDSVQT
jgi:hypothetical protein